MSKASLTMSSAEQLGAQLSEVTAKLQLVSQQLLDLHKSVSSLPKANVDIQSASLTHQCTLETCDDMPPLEEEEENENENKQNREKLSSFPEMPVEMVKQVPPSVETKNDTEIQSNASTSNLSSGSSETSSHSETQKYFDRKDIYRMMMGHHPYHDNLMKAAYEEMIAHLSKSGIVQVTERSTSRDDLVIAAKIKDGAYYTLSQFVAYLKTQPRRFDINCGASVTFYKTTFHKSVSAELFEQLSESVGTIKVNNDLKYHTERFDSFNVIDLDNNDVNVGLLCDMLSSYVEEYPDAGVCIDKRMIDISGKITIKSLLGPIFRDTRLNPLWRDKNTSCMPLFEVSADRYTNGGSDSNSPQHDFYKLLVLARDCIANGMDTYYVGRMIGDSINHSFDKVPDLAILDKNLVFASDLATMLGERATTLAARFFTPMRVWCKAVDIKFIIGKSSLPLETLETLIRTSPCVEKDLNELDTKHQSRGDTWSLTP